MPFEQAAWETQENTGSQERWEEQQAVFRKMHKGGWELVEE